MQKHYTHVMQYQTMRMYNEELSQFLMRKTIRAEAAIKKSQSNNDIIYKYLKTARWGKNR